MGFNFYYGLKYGGLRGSLRVFVGSLDCLWGSLSVFMVFYRGISIFNRD